MPTAHANGIELEYDTLGEGEPLVLIMGIGSQMIWWPEELCRGFAERGFHVIRFDNRDVGLSTKLHHLPVPNIRRVMLRGMLGLSVDAPYTLVDMADDVAGLLDALELPAAHVLGVSLGGMVAQTMAIVHPNRVLSLTSIMSGPGNRWKMIGKPKAILTLLRKPPKNADEAIENHLHFISVCGSPAFPHDEAAAAELAARAYHRCVYPRGFSRQMAAVMATGDRTSALRFVRTPTLVMHGSHDPLIPPSAGKATARAIPGANLRIVEGMGHDLPEGVCPIICDAVAEHALRTRARSSQSRRRS